MLFRLFFQSTGVQVNFYKTIRILILKFFPLLLSIILIIIASFKYYEMRYFKPHIPYLEKTYIQAKKEENFTEMTKNIIFCLEIPSYHKNNPYAHVAGIVARHFVEELIEYKRIGDWHIHNLLWSQLLRYYFDDEELFILFLHLKPFEHGFGLANSAQYHFKKTIPQLTVEELVMLLGIAQSPLYSPSGRARRIQGIFEKLEELNCLSDRN